MSHTNLIGTVTEMIKYKSCLQLVMRRGSPCAWCAIEKKYNMKLTNHKGCDKYESR
jgi:hypothetical protein